MAAQRVRMRSNTIFSNDAVTIFPKDGPKEGIKGRPVTPDEEFETDDQHARELKALGHADLIHSGALDGEPGPLEPHFTVSEPQLRASRAKHAPTPAAAAPAALAARPAPIAPAKV